VSPRQIPHRSALRPEAPRPAARRARALAYAAIGPVVVLGSASPALAFGNHRSDGDDPGSGISILHGVLLYIGVPVLVAVVIWILAFLPATTRQPRYRPGLGWRAAPVWFGGPRSAADRERVTGVAPVEGNGGVSADW